MIVSVVSGDKIHRSLRATVGRVTFVKFTTAEKSDEKQSLA